MTQLIFNILLFMTVSGGFAWFLVFWLDFVPFYKLQSKRKHR